MELKLSNIFLSHTPTHTLIFLFFIDELESEDSASPGVFVEGSWCSSGQRPVHPTHSWWFCSQRINRQNSSTLDTRRSFHWHLWTGEFSKAVNHCYDQQIRSLISHSITLQTAIMTLLPKWGKESNAMFNIFDLHVLCLSFKIFLHW